jgi:hypothetical protein
VCQPQATEAGTQLSGVLPHTLERVIVTAPKTPPFRWRPAVICSIEFP